MPRVLCPLSLGHLVAALCHLRGQKRRLTRLRVETMSERRNRLDRNAQLRVHRSYRALTGKPKRCVSSFPVLLLYSLPHLCGVCVVSSDLSIAFVSRSSSRLGEEYEYEYARSTSTVPHCSDSQPYRTALVRLYTSRCALSRVEQQQGVACSRLIIKNPIQPSLLQRASGTPYLYPLALRVLVPYASTAPSATCSESGPCQIRRPMRPMP